MSTQRVKLVSVVTLQYTAVIAANELVVTTTTNHNLATGNLVSLRFQNSPQELSNVPVIVSGATQFAIILTPTVISVLNGISAGPLSSGGFGESPSVTINAELGMSGNTYNGQVVISFYGTGQTGGQPYFTVPRGTSGQAAILQSYVNGTGGATYTLELSLDGVHWITSVATVTHAGTTGDTAFVTIAPSWAYARINPSVIGAATTLVALLSI